MAHPQTLTYSILFSCLECLSTSVRCWPPTSTTPPATWPSPPTASGTCDSQPPPSPLPRFPNPVSGPPRRANGDGLIAATPTAAAHRAITAVGTRHHTHRNSPITEFVGITTNSRIVQIDAKIPVIGPAPMPGRETARPPARAHGPSGRRPPRPIPNSHSNGDVFFARLRFNVFQRFLQQVKFSSRLRSLAKHYSVFFFSNATWSKTTWSKWRQYPHLGISNKNVKISTNTFEHEFLLAKVAIPILGLDIFRKFQLSISPAMSGIG
jgi:hypothetical protein